MVREIQKHPVKILDAPDMRDDFYYNVLDWNQRDELLVALGQVLYVWNASTALARSVYSIEIPDHYITSVKWSPHADTLAMGNTSGEVHLYDAKTLKKTAHIHDNASRVGALSWNGNVITTGGKDKIIRSYDVRCTKKPIMEYSGHTQEICNLKWSQDGNYLASGGNDNKVCIWTPKFSDARARMSEHTAAIRALAWSPHQRNILATGGGTSDKTIKIWNIGSMSL